MLTSMMEVVCGRKRPEGEKTLGLVYNSECFILFLYALSFEE